MIRMICRMPTMPRRARRRTGLAKEQGLCLA
jgi:hypothetical protein